MSPNLGLNNLRGFDFPSTIFDGIFCGAGEWDEEYGGEGEEDTSEYCEIRKEDFSHESAQKKVDDAKHSLAISKE